MMEKTAVFNKVIELITPFCKNTEALKNVTESTRFLEDLQVNSARLVDIVLDMEDAFGIEIDDESADKIRAVGDAVNLIVSKTN
jgi:acyl carrier protein